MDPYLSKNSLWKMPECTPTCGLAAEKDILCNLNLDRECFWKVVGRKQAWIGELEGVVLWPLGPDLSSPIYTASLGVYWLPICLG